MIMNKENWIQHTMEILDERMVEEYVKEYRVSEYEARKRLAEMYYDDTLERHSDIVGFVQY